MQSAVTTDHNVSVPSRPPKIARLRLLLGYIVILGAFFVNEGYLNWWALPLVILGSAIRMWSAGTLVKTRELSTDGPYALSRNPLYLGTFIAGVGLALFVHSIWLLAFFVITFYLAYSAQISWEEKVLRREHGEAFEDYKREVGRFFPLKWPKGLLRGSFSWQRMKSNKEISYQLFWLVMMAGLITQSYLAGLGIGLEHP